MRPYLGIGDQNLWGGFSNSVVSFYGLRAYVGFPNGTGINNQPPVLGRYPLINIRRTSDSATCDIMVNPTTGGLGNTAACTNSTDNGTLPGQFCSGTTCVVPTWYDQLNRGHDVSQATNGSQPTLNLSCYTNPKTGVVLPCVQTTTAVFLTGTASAVSQPVGLATVARRTGLTSAINSIAQSSTTWFAGWNSTASTGVMNAGTTSITNATISDSAVHALVYNFNGASSQFVVDGTATTASATPGATGISASAGVFGIGSRGTTNTNPCACDIFEVAIFNYTFGAGNQFFACRNASDYYGLGLTTC